MFEHMLRKTLVVFKARISAGPGCRDMGKWPCFPCLLSMLADLGAKLAMFLLLLAIWGSRWFMFPLFLLALLGFCGARIRGQDGQPRPSTGATQANLTIFDKQAEGEAFQERQGPKFGPKMWPMLGPQKPRCWSPDCHPYWSPARATLSPPITPPPHYSQ